MILIKVVCHRTYLDYHFVSCIFEPGGYPWDWWLIYIYMASLVAQMIKNLPAMWQTWVQFLVWEDTLEKGTATHSSILVWRISWTEEPGRLQSMGSQRYICMYIYILYIYILSHDYPSSLTSIVNTMAETNILKRY